MSKVNGWSNYETWNFMLWYGDVISDNIEYEDLNTKEAIEAEVQGYVDQMEEEALEGQSGFASDIISRAISMIDVEEITTSFLKD